jgi:hypothetical protein
MRILRNLRYEAPTWRRSPLASSALGASRCSHHSATERQRWPALASRLLPTPAPRWWEHPPRGVGISSRATSGISPHGMSPPLRLPTNRWPNGAPGSISWWKRMSSFAGHALARRPRSRQGALRSESRCHPALAHGRGLGRGVTSAPAYGVR